MFRTAIAKPASPIRVKLTIISDQIDSIHIEYICQADNRNLFFTQHQHFRISNHFQPVFSLIGADMDQFADTHLRNSKLFLIDRDHQTGNDCQGKR